MMNTKVSIVFYIVCFITNSLYSQITTLKGRVISEHMEILPFTSIMIDDSVKIGTTDIEGFYQIAVPPDVDKITFKEIGMEESVVSCFKDCEEIEVVMLYSSSYDFMPPRKIDRQRKKRMKKQRKLHKIAFSKGLFQSNKPCYSIAFIPFFKKK